MKKLITKSSTDNQSHDPVNNSQHASTTNDVLARRRGLFAAITVLVGGALGVVSRRVQAGHQGGSNFHLNVYNGSKDYTNLRRQSEKKNSWTLGADCVTKDSASGAIRGDINGSGIGVLGNNLSYGQGGLGVWGWCGSGVGVLGQNDMDEKSGGGYGVLGQSPDVGVKGEGDWAGVIGTSNRNGLEGYSKKQCGVFGSAEGDNGIAICGYKVNKQLGHAGHFVGNVYVSGDFDVQGAKNAVVPFPDGSLRRLYSMESPESWFEDFGEAQLLDGQVEVPIDSGFSAVTEAPYHVFLTPYDDTRGLHVAKRSQGTFEVREVNGGKGKVSFGYRIVAKRKDIQAPRFAEVTPPRAPRLGQERVVLSRTKPPRVSE